jgi:nitrite reductase/ring-hydroxylating ferredoxin subunit
MLLRHAHGEPVILARRDDELLAIAALRTHYGAPLVDGLLVNDTVRCPCGITPASACAPAGRFARPL